MGDDKDPAPSTSTSTPTPVQPPTNPSIETAKNHTFQDAKDANTVGGVTKATTASSLFGSNASPEQPKEASTPMDLEKEPDPTAQTKSTKTEISAQVQAKENPSAQPTAQKPTSEALVQTATAAATAPVAKPMAVPVLNDTKLKGKEEAARATAATGTVATANPAAPLPPTKKRKLPPVPTTTTVTPSTITTTNKPPGVTQLLQDMPIVQQVTMDLLALLQSYGPLTAGQLDYNLPPKLSSYSATSASLLQDILQVLVAVGLVQILQKDPQQPPRYGLTRGIPRADVVMPWTVLHEIQVAHTEASRSAARSKRLIEALSNPSSPSAKEILRKLLLDYPEIMQDPVYLTALRNCHVDVAAVERERRMPEGMVIPTTSSTKKKSKTTAATTTSSSKPTTSKTTVLPQPAAQASTTLSATPAKVVPQPQTKAAPAPALPAPAAASEAAAPPSTTTAVLQISVVRQSASEKATAAPPVPIPQKTTETTAATTAAQGLQAAETTATGTKTENPAAPPQPTSVVPTTEKKDLVTTSEKTPE